MIALANENQGADITNLELGDGDQFVLINGNAVVQLHGTFNPVQGIAANVSLATYAPR